MIGVGLWCIFKVKRWRQHQEVHAAQDDLASLQSMRDRGLLTQEEFDRIRVKLGPKNSVAGDSQPGKHGSDVLPDGKIVASPESPDASAPPGIKDHDPPARPI